MAELASRLRIAGLTGWREYASVYSRRIIVTSVLPRALAQAIFYVFIARLLAGPAGARWAFIGSVGYAAATATVVRLPDVLAADKHEGTLFRLRLGRLPHPVVAACRSWPYVAEGAASALAVLVLVGPLAGLGSVTLRLVPLLPLLALPIASCAAFGLAIAAVSVGRRADVLAGNLAMSVLLVGCQIVAQIHSPWLGRIGQVLPLEHGLTAIRLALAHRDPFGQLAWEAAVGACWLAFACLTLVVQASRSARLGTDDFE